MSEAWTPAAVAELQRLWCERGVSAADIAALLSSQFGQPITRAAVLGRVHRMGLQKPAGQAPAAAAAKTQADPAPLIPQASRGVLLWDLQMHHCRYILPERRDGQVIYCGAVHEHAKSSWCPHHAAKVWEQRPAVSRDRYRAHLLEQRAEKSAARSPALATEQA